MYIIIICFKNKYSSRVKIGFAQWHKLLEATKKQMKWQNVSMSVSLARRLEALPGRHNGINSERKKRERGRHGDMGDIQTRCLAEINKAAKRRQGRLNRWATAVEEKGKRHIGSCCCCCCYFIYCC